MRDRAMREGKSRHFRVHDKVVIGVMRVCVALQQYCIS